MIRLVHRLLNDCSICLCFTLVLIASYKYHWTFEPIESQIEAQQNNEDEKQMHKICVYLFFFLVMAL